MKTITGSVVAPSHDEALRMIDKVIVAYEPNRPVAGGKPRISTEARPVMVQELGHEAAVLHFEVDYEVVL